MGRMGRAPFVFNTEKRSFCTEIQNNKKKIKKKLYSTTSNI